MDINTNAVARLASIAIASSFALAGCSQTEPLPPAAKVAASVPDNDAETVQVKWPPTSDASAPIASQDRHATPAPATAPPQNPPSPSIAWARVRQDWIYADAPRRVELFESVINHVDSLITNDAATAGAERDAANAFVLANARTEQDPAVLVKFLPLLATLERHESEPVLFIYLADNRLTPEVRATAAEILVESGWWTAPKLLQWLDSISQSADERAALFDELADSGIRP